MDDIRERLLSDENIYLAIFQLPSYIQHLELLNNDDLVLLEKLKDPFNVFDIKNTIRLVRAAIENVITSEDEFFTCDVYFKPKKKSAQEDIVFRPLHVSRLIDQLAMISMLQVLVFNVNSEGALESSDINNLVPENFYGNIISFDGKHLFFPWSYQYKEYQKKAKILRNKISLKDLDWYLGNSDKAPEKEYKAEIKLDIHNFFACINPNIVYELIMDYLSEIYPDSDLSLVKTIIRKLLIIKLCELSKTEMDWYLAAFKNTYDCSSISKIDYTIGLAQGLPHTYFFANIFMEMISLKYQEDFSGDMLFYVDDSIIFSKESMDEDTFTKKVDNLNLTLCAFEDCFAQDCINRVVKDGDFSQSNGNVGILPKEYTFKDLHTYIHSPKEPHSKSTITLIDETENLELQRISDEADTLNLKIRSLSFEGFNQELFNKVEALKEFVEIQLSSLDEDDYLKPRYISLDKFFKFKELLLKDKTQNFKAYIQDNILPFVSLENHLDAYLVNKVSVKEDFFEEMYQGILLYKVEFVLKNYFYDLSFRHEFINTLNKLMALIYGEHQEHSYLKKSWGRFTSLTSPYQIEYSKYDSLTDSISSCLSLVKNRSEDKKADYFTQLVKTIEDGLDSDSNALFELLSLDETYSLSSYVRQSNDELVRMIFNAAFSFLFDFEVSDLIKFEDLKSKLNLTKLKTYLILRNRKFSLWYDLVDLHDFDEPSLKESVDEGVIELLKTFIKENYRFDFIKSFIELYQMYCAYKKEHVSALEIGLSENNDAICLLNNAIKISSHLSYLNKKNVVSVSLVHACFMLSMLKLLDKENSEDDAENINKIKEFAKASDFKFLKSSESIVLEVLKNESEFYQALANNPDKKILKIILRLANCIDTTNSENCALAFFNSDNLEGKDKFDFISQMLTDSMSLESEYSCNKADDLNKSDYSIFEKIKVKANVLFDKQGKVKEHCKFANQFNCVIDTDIKTNLPKATISLTKQNCKECNFMCKWFMTKNEDLIKELIAFNDFLDGDKTKLYKTKIDFVVSSVSTNDLKNKAFKDFINYIH